MGKEAQSLEVTAAHHGVRKQGMNEAIVAGELVAAPESRVLPSGSTAMSFSLTVRTAHMKTTSVPAVWYDPPKRVLQWQPGEMIVVQGAVVRRFFRGAGGLGSSTEVVVARAEMCRHEKKAERVVRHAAAALDLPGDSTEHS